MIWAIIISGICFTVGNIIWPFFNEPKLFYVPLAVFISLMLFAVKKLAKGMVQELFVTFLFVLSLGNIVKQLFYTGKIKQINDYWWGGIVLLWLLIQLIIWATRKTVRGIAK